MSARSPNGSVGESWGARAGPGLPDRNRTSDLRARRSSRMPENIAENAPMAIPIKTTRAAAMTTTKTAITTYIINPVHHG